MKIICFKFCPKSMKVLYTYGGEGLMEGTVGDDFEVVLCQCTVPGPEHFCFFKIPKYRKQLKKSQYSKSPSFLTLY